MSRNNNNTATNLNELERWQALLQAQQEEVDRQLELAVQAEQRRLLEEHWWEEARQLAEEKRMEEAEWKRGIEELWRIQEAEKEDEEDDDTLY